MLRINFTILSLSIICFCSAIQAQTGKNRSRADTSRQLQAVIVTATKGLNERENTLGKINITPMDLPQSSVVIGKNVLERQQTLRLSEALMNIIGVYIYGTTGGSQEEIGGRGYAFNSTNTFKNGVRYNNAALPEMSSLEKIEVIKGSAAILFGNVAAGGVLNLVTKKPKFEKGGEVSMRIGSNDFYKPSFDIYGPVNKNIAYRINTTYEKANSFRDDVNSERYYINPSFLFKLGKKTDLILEGDYLKDNRVLDYGTGAINYAVANIPRNRFLGAAWSYYKTEQKTATATFTHHLNSNWLIKSISGYQGFSSDGFGTTRPNNTWLVQPNGNWIRGLQRSGSKEDYFIEQLDFTGNFNTGSVKHTLLAGADASLTETDANAYTYSNTAAGNKNIYDSINIFVLNKYQQRNDIPVITATTITHTPTKRAGVYVQDLVSITEKLRLLAGVRYSYQQTGNGYIDSIQKTKRTQVAKSNDDAFSPRIGFVYQPAKTISLFASYSNSFTINTGTDIYLQPLKPSYLSQYEAGLKTELFKKRVSANVTVYMIINCNLAQISLQDINGNSNSNTNIKELAGEVTSKGLEAEVMSKPIRGFSFIAGYSYNDTRYTRSNTYIVDSRLLYNPKHTANASVYYNFSNRTFLKGFSGGFIAYYVGKRSAGRSTRVQVVNDAFKPMPLPDYMQLDGSIAWTNSNFSLRFKVSNIFNKLTYYVHDDNSVNPIAPRQFAATVVLKL